MRIAGKDPVGAFLRLTESYAPRLAAEASWRRYQHGFSQRVVDVLIRPGMTVVDIGAAKGDFTNRMAQLVGSKGRVHAFEPDPEALRALSAIAGRYPSVAVHEIAMSDSDGLATLHVPVVAGRRAGILARLSVPAGAAAEYEEVEVRKARLDGLLSDEKAIHFVKCDVEGHEYEALHGAQRTLDQMRPPLLIEIEQRHQTRDIHETFEYLADLGYSGFAVAHNGLLPVRYFDVRLHQPPEGSSRRFVGGSAYVRPDYMNDFLFVTNEYALGNLPVKSSPS